MADDPQAKKVEMTSTAGSNVATSQAEHDPSLWVEQYGDYLFRQAKLRVGRPEVAEELVQETFLAALKALDNFEGRSSMKTWLRGILKNKCIDYLRKSVREEVVDELKSDDDITSELFYRTGVWRKWIHRWEGSPEESAEQQQFMLQLERCLRNLPERIGKVFALKALDNLSSDEVCKQLDLTSSNLWVIMYRARVHLRECMDRNWYRKV